jgi:hypothetical protein
MATMTGAQCAVLGIDAAWTDSEPSGVALAIEIDGAWRLAAVEASYGHFLERAKGARLCEDKPRGSEPDAEGLVDAAREIAGRRIDLVAVDPRFARYPITGRRLATS